MNDHSSDNSDDSSDDGGGVWDARGQYDQTLPGQHSYLGHSNQLSGRTLLDETQLQKLLIHFMPGYILMPNQVFPLKISEPSFVSVIQSLISTTKTFGVVTIELDRDNQTWRDTIGTTAEIYEYSEHRLDDTEAVVLNIKARGRQRFRLVSGEGTRLNGHLVAKVAILPEIKLGHPLASARLRSCDKLAKRIVSRVNDVSTSQEDSEEPKYEVSVKLSKINIQAVSHFPSWLFDMYDAKMLAERVQKALLDCEMVSSKNRLPSDPEQLSWWVASNLPLTDKHKLRLLSIDNCIHRLREELTLIGKCQVLVCLNCQTKLADQTSIFSMSTEGPQGTFINPNGHLHETLTLHHAINLSAIGSPSVEYSWFPGYAWTVLVCSSCYSHIGWRFTATRSSMQPETFHGFSRKSIMPKLVAPSADNEVSSDAVQQIAL